MDKKQADNLAEVTAQEIIKGFNKHYRIFKTIAADCQRSFEKRDWTKIATESERRIYSYDKQVRLCTQRLAKKNDLSLFNETLWSRVKLVYINLISMHQQPELAETFYNSVFCRLFDKQFYNNSFIFVKPSISTSYIDIDNPIINSDYLSGCELKDNFRAMIKRCRFRAAYEDLERDLERLQEQFIKHFAFATDTSFEIQSISSIFFREKAAYLIGRVVCQNSTYPMVIALRHEQQGIYIDALLTDDKAITEVFNFSRSYFLVKTDYPSAVVAFLKELMPTKTKANLYSSIGLHKHGKNLLYRMFLRYTKISNEKLITAPGINGMVMSVFTFPMYPYVFKVINDQFLPPKTGNRKMVKDKYHFVKNHVKIGRLADTWEFSNVAFPINSLDKNLLKTLTEKAPSMVEVEEDLVIIKHLYMENKMMPLNIYLDSATEQQKEHIINDYAKAIDELINANIFPGDMLTKNFGVTQQNKVVFYDYDEITTMDKPVFRNLPKPQNEQQAMAQEPWYHIGEDDVFPEEFNFFIFTDDKMKKIFNTHYAQLFDADYWRLVQKNIKQNKLREFYPYEKKRRMCRLYQQ